MEPVLIEEKNAEKKEKLWNLNFFLLWQGQFISLFGDVIYEVALGFWVLELTGSTAIMGMMMAVAIIPGVLIAPFAGVFVDRWDRKRLLILMEGIRAVVIIFVGIAAYEGFINLWLVVIAEIIVGICGAFFGPAMNSAVPDVIPKSKLTNATSCFGIIQTTSNIIGNSIGGIIFQLFGAPLMFLLNGISFLISGLLQIFAKIPKIEKTGEEVRFMEDMKIGYLFLWKFMGLRYFLLNFSVTNFTVCIATVLLLPLFQMTESLGPEKYGIFMAFFTGGSLMGMVFTSIIQIPPAKRLLVFMASTIISNLSFMMVALLENFPVMLAFIFVGGVFIAILEVLSFSTVQLIIPQDMRGKVFALIGMVTQSLAPLGMALGGILGEFIPIRTIIFVCFFSQLLFSVPFAFIPFFKRFMNFDPASDTLENI